MLVWPFLKVTKRECRMPFSGFIVVFRCLDIGSQRVLQQLLIFAAKKNQLNRSRIPKSVPGAIPGPDQPYVA